MPSVPKPFTYGEFEGLARRVLSAHYGRPLSTGSVVGVRKKFDFVSADGQIVGDAKYFTRVGGARLPPAKCSVIAEHVWLLERTRSPETFLVFGNDLEVPTLWLERWGNLLLNTKLYFPSDDGQSALLIDPRATRTRR